jgi:peptide chain release factor 1
MTPAVLDKLKSVEARYDALTHLISGAAVQADPAAYRAHSKELAEIEELVERFREYRRVADSAAEARELAASGDADLAGLASEELRALEPRLAALEQEMQRLLVPRDPHDDRNVVLEIRAGTGGDEAALFAADLFRMYSRYAERHRWRLEVLSTSATGVGGIKEVIATIEGKGVYRFMKHESGVHRVQRVPATEASGRIHTSTATVAVLPEAEDVEIEIDPRDLRIDTFCSSGPGGQSVNTTYSAVRVTHLPTGLVVSQQDEKSQIKNRQKALKVLRYRLHEIELRKQQEAIARERRGQVGTGERSEKIRTYNFKENRITDHRVNFTIHQLADVLDGDLDELIAVLEERMLADKLREAVREA